jgi:hypothetical protein
MDMEKENMVTNEEREVLEAQKIVLETDIADSQSWRGARELAAMVDALAKLTAKLDSE